MLDDIAQGMISLSVQVTEQELGIFQTLLAHFPILSSGKADLPFHSFVVFLGFGEREGV